MCVAVWFMGLLSFIVECNISPVGSMRLPVLARRALDVMVARELAGQLATTHIRECDLLNPPATRR